MVATSHEHDDPGKAGRAARPDRTIPTASGSLAPISRRAPSADARAALGGGGCVGQELRRLPRAAVSADRLLGIGVSDLGRSRRQGQGTPAGGSDLRSPRRGGNKCGCSPKRGEMRGEKRPPVAAYAAGLRSSCRQDAAVFLATERLRRKSDCLIDRTPQPWRIRHPARPGPGVHADALKCHETGPAGARGSTIRRIALALGLLQGNHHQAAGPVGWESAGAALGRGPLGNLNAGRAAVVLDDLESGCRGQSMNTSVVHAENRILELLIGFELYHLEADVLCFLL